MKIFVWTDADLDGAGCLLALKWLKPFGECEMEYRQIGNGSLTCGMFENWNAENLDKYDRVIVCDLSIPPGVIQSIDHEKYLVIDHHKTHELEKDRYEKAKHVIREYPSCTKLVYDVFKNRIKHDLDDNKLDFIKYVNDYDSYTLNFEESFKLNVILKSSQYPDFVRSFSDGMREFTDLENNMVMLYTKKLYEQIEGDKFVYEHNGVKFVACFVERYASEVAHFVLKRTKADVCICVNSNMGSVSFRRAIGSNYKVNELAEKLCNGGGHEYAAGGKITDQFLNFMKLLQPL